MSELTLSKNFAKQKNVHKKACELREACSPYEKLGHLIVLICNRILNILKCWTDMAHVY